MIILIIIILNFRHLRIYYNHYIQAGIMVLLVDGSALELVNALFAFLSRIITKILLLHYNTLYVEYFLVYTE